MVEQGWEWKEWSCCSASWTTSERPPFSLVTPSALRPDAREKTLLGLAHHVHLLGNLLLEASWQSSAHAHKHMGSVLVKYKPLLR